MEKEYRRKLCVDSPEGKGTDYTRNVGYITVDSVVSKRSIYDEESIYMLTKNRVVL